MKDEDGYWPQQEIQVRFAGSGTAVLELDYAYCYVESLCFLRSTVITLSADAGSELESRDDGLRTTSK